MSRLLAVLIALVLGTAASACSVDQNNVPAASSAGPSYTQWDPKTWKSPIKITVPELTPAEAEKARRARLDELAAELKAIPEKIPTVIRVVLPEEWGQAQAKCLTEAGWPGNAVGDPEGGLRTVDPPKSQQKAFDIARYTCQAQYPVDPRVMKLDQSTVDAIQWQYLKEYGIPCVAAHGFVTPTPLPSKEAYMAGAPFRLYPLKPYTKPDELLRDCPQAPPTVTLLGG